MAKFECEVYENFELFLNYIEEGILNGSFTATLEDGSNFQDGDLKVAVRVFERYSAFNSNRLSMNLTVIGKNDKLFVSVITSGAGNGLFKILPIGEETFLEKFIELMRRYEK